MILHLGNQDLLLLPDQLTLLEALGKLLQLLSSLVQAYFLAVRTHLVKLASCMRELDALFHKVLLRLLVELLILGGLLQGTSQSLLLVKLLSFILIELGGIIDHSRS